MNIDRLEIVTKLAETSHKPSLSKGDKVRCIDNDEKQSRWGGNDSAQEYLTIGQVYTLAADPEIHSWHTKHYLEEVPGKKFNSVQFERVAYTDPFPQESEGK